ncbi:MAG TPA: hypothetical protein VK184_02845 [Nostocaceae cyanobacterium]|nr:hypothetical protein [Nostocaceae cyanobacterium]
MINFHPDIQELVENQRFIEALYFGVMEQQSNPSSELHLNLGISCCATIKPIADIERYLKDRTSYEETSSFVNPVVDVEGLGVVRSTMLVNEGLHHFLQAKRLNPQIQVPDSLKPITITIIQDLQDYLRQEFQGYSTSLLEYKLRIAGLAATVLLCELQGDNPKEKIKLYQNAIDSAYELISKLFATDNKQSFFYALNSS